MARIAFVLADDFEDPEFKDPYDHLTDAGHHIDVIGVDSGTEVTGKRGEVSHTTNLAARAADPDDYDALVIPGGYSPDKLRTDEDVVSFVRRIVERGVPTAAICHAGSLLIEAGAVAGRQVTSWPSIRTDLVNAGARWIDDEVVTDANLITSRNPGDIPAFNRAIDDALDDGVIDLDPTHSQDPPFDPAEATPTGSP